MDAVPRWMKKRIDNLAKFRSQIVKEIAVDVIVETEQGKFPLWQSPHKVFVYLQSPCDESQQNMDKWIRVNLETSGSKLGRFGGCEPAEVGARIHDSTHGLGGILRDSRSHCGREGREERGRRPPRRRPRRERAWARPW